MGTVTRRVRVLLTALTAVLSTGAAPAGATFPGTNGKIAYWNVSGFVTQIWTIGHDGTHRTTITSIDRHNFAPTWSADGSRIAFVSERDHRAPLVIMNADGTDLTTVLTARAITQPSWSPDGDRIAFYGGLERDAPWRLFVLDLDDGQVSAICRQCSSPDWSPDGARIVVDHLGGRFGLMTMDPDGSERVGITRRDSEVPDANNASWSPDGTRIAFTAGESHDIYTVGADGSDLTRVTHTTDHWEASVVWSPDGTRFAYIRTADPYWDTRVDLWTINVDGSDAGNVTRTPKAFEWGPDWRAR